MGLPVWRAPSPADFSKDVLPSSRTPIRRRSPMRARRYSRSPRLNDRRASSLAYSLDHDGRVRIADSISRGPSPLPPVPESRNFMRERGPTYEEPFQDTLYPTPYVRAHSSREGRRRPLSPQLPGVWSSRRHGIIPPPPPRDYSSFPPPQPRSTEPLAELHYSQSSRFGPRSLPPPYSASSRSNFDDSYFDWVNRRDEIPPAVNAEFPPLRRMGHRSIADGPLLPSSHRPNHPLRESWSPNSAGTPTADNGLGDRERSFSPEDDHWETMLTTIAPDTHLPSADSSFTSAAASASFSNGGSRSASTRSISRSSGSEHSDRTHLTVPEEREADAEDAQERYIRDQFHFYCETTDDSGTDTEAEGEDEHESLDVHAPSTHAHTIPTFRPRFLGVSRGGRPRSYSRSSSRRQRIPDLDRFIRLNAAATALRNESNRNSNGGSGSATSSANTSSADLPLADPELEQMRGILERLARRDDIPEEWWMSAGLTPTIANAGAGTGSTSTGASSGAVGNAMSRGLERL